MKTIPIDIEQINAFLKMKGEIGLKKETIVEYRRVLMRFRENLFPEFELKPDTLQYWNPLKCMYCTCPLVILF